MNSKKFAAAAAALLAVSLAAYTRGQAKADPKDTAAAVPMPKTDRIAMAEFKKLFAANDVVVVDVRATDAYAGGHIPGALSIPEETLTPVIAEKLKRMGKPVATYCSWQAEHTSARAAQTLQKMGVPARAIVGGLNTWVQEKNPMKYGIDAK